MKLPIPSFGNNKDKSDYYLTLLLNDEKVSAVILEETEGKIKVLSKQTEKFSKSIEEIELEDLIETIDKTISHAEEILPPHIETHKTVFGVKENWVEEKKIKKEYLAKLKKVCNSLDLSPMGFIVISEAIANLMQEEEGAPISAVLVEIGNTNTTLTLVRGGKNLETISGPIEESVTQTVDTQLKHFTIDVLPSRIILFHTQNSEDIAQQFISFQWSKSLPFLHMPQITVLPVDFDAKAVVAGAANQMGLEMLPSMSDAPSETIKNYDQKVATRPETPLGSDTSQPVKIKDAPVLSSTTPVDTLPKNIASDNFGFVMDKDIEEVYEENPERKDAIDEDTIDTEPHFTIHSSSEQKEETDEDEEDTNTLHMQPKQFDETVQSTNRTRIGSGDYKSKTANFAFLSNLLSLKDKISLPRLPSLPFGKNSVILPIAGIVILVLLIIGAYYLYSSKLQASVIVSIKPKIVEQTDSVIFNTDGTNDFGNNIIAAQSVSDTLSGSDSTNATGKTEVGTPAKGTVTIYNSDVSSNAQLSAGTQIKSSNGLLFTLDKDINVASASGDIFSGTKPGTAQVTVTAKDIGTDYNLPSATKFTVASSSSLAGKNDSAFSGGTKKTVTVVAKADIDKLKTDVINSLQDKAQSDISSKAQSGQTVLPIIINSSLGKTNVDKNIGDQATTVKLTADVTFQGIAYKNDDVLTFAQQFLRKHYASDTSFSDKSIKSSFTNMKQKNEKEIAASIAVQAGILPNINQQDIINKLAGKSYKDALTLLSALPQIESSDIKLSPYIPFIPKSLPHSSSHITLSIKSDE